MKFPRRQFLQISAALATAYATPRPLRGGTQTMRGLVGEISQHKIFAGRSMEGPSWFHPRPTVISSVNSSTVLMTLQLISGSDVFGPVHWTESTDQGATWSIPEPIPGLGRTDLEPNWQRGVCDVVPEYHPQSNTVLAIGHDVFYENGVLAKPQRARRPVYIVRTADGNWSEPQHLEWDNPNATGIFSCGCSERVPLPDGDVLIPFTFGPLEPFVRSVTSVRCGFDGETLTVKESGSVLSNSAGRGLLEPSLVQFNDRYFMTIRAEDGHGYVSSSEDGLNWNPQQAWRWDDGAPITMSTTQQHWLPHSEGLFLVYTRETPENTKVIRFRAPLFMARVDPDAMTLIRDSERVVVPLSGDLAHPRNVALMGNFHTLNVSPHESWVTVGENRPYDGYLGDTWLARISWTEPNRSFNTT